MKFILRRREAMNIFAGHLSNAYLLLVLLVVLVLSGTSLAVAPNAPENLQAYSKNNPVGTNDQPFFGWYVNDPDDNEIQTAYQIQVASSQALLDADNGDLWDSGKVASDKQNYVYYDGAVLTAATRYYWKVRTWDKDDNASPYSAIGVFDTGLLDNADWSGAQWIKRNTTVSDDFTYYRKTLTLPGKTVRRAIVYVTACHDYELYINGSLIGKGPAYHYPQHAYYNAYDITDALASGAENAFAALTHWFGGGQGRPSGSRGFLLKAVVEYADGTETVIGTDGTWKQRQASAWVTGQPQRKSGEGVGYVTKIDAREIIDNWQSLGFNDSSWSSATVIGSHPTSPWTGVLQPDLTDVIEEVVTPASVTHLGGGKYVVDFGKVYPGMPRVEFSGGSSGTTVNMRGGYTLNSDGTVSTSTDQKTNMSYYFILDGQTAVFEPIVYLGMRYFQVDNSPMPLTTDNVRFIKRHYEFDLSRSNFTSSNAMLNTVWEVMKDSLISCAQEALVDTPTREKGGFLGDAWSQGAAGMVAMGDRVMNQRVLKEFVMSQNQYWPDGRMNAVYPNGDGKRDIPDYTQMFPLWVWDYYMQTGDVGFLSEHYDTVKNIADYVNNYRNSSTGLIQNLAGGGGAYVYGIIDWPSTMRYGYDMNAADRTVINAYAWADYDVVSRIADILGDSADRDSYRDKADAIESAMNSQLFNSSGEYIDGLYSDGSQSGHVSQHANMFPLALGIVPADKLDTVVAAVKDREMSCGMVTVRFLCEAVGRSDEGTHLLNLYTNPEWDGWADNIAKGATTTWESWDADTQGQSMSHAWGAVGLLGITEYMVGLKALLPQHELVQIKPLDFGDSLTDVDAMLPTDRGDIRVTWTRGDGFSMTVILPDNVRAKVYVPKCGVAGANVKVDGMMVSATPEGDYLYVENIGSGTHSFERTVLAYDFDGDGFVGLSDFAVLAEHWLECGRIPASKCDE